MKMKIAFVIPLIAFVLILLVACTPAAQIFEFSELDTPERWPLEERYAIAQGQKLAENHIAYYMSLDEFAGAWFCQPGYLNIALTIVPDTKVDGIVYHHHQFSYNFLETLMNFIWGLENIDNLVSTFIREQDNYVQVELASSGDEANNDIRQIIRHLRSAGLWNYEAVIFVTGVSPIVLLPLPYLPIIVAPEVQIVKFGEQEEYYDLPLEERYAIDLGNYLSSKYIAYYRSLDVFAGAWLCRVGHFNVALTIIPETKVDGIIYHLYEFSHDFLLTVMDFIWQLENINNVTLTGIAGRLNHVEVMLTSSGGEAIEDIVKIIDHLEAAGLWDYDAVLFIIGAPPLVSGPLFD